jgi:hypothetical protein
LVSGRFLEYHGDELTNEIAVADNKPSIVDSGYSATIPSHQAPQCELGLLLARGSRRLVNVFWESDVDDFLVEQTVYGLWATSCNLADVVFFKAIQYLKTPAAILVKASHHSNGYVL